MPPPPDDEPLEPWHEPPRHLPPPTDPEPAEPPAVAEPMPVSEGVPDPPPGPPSSPALIDEAPTTPNDESRLRLSDIARHIEETVQPVHGDARTAATKKQRASVPTWDEIMFGRRRRHE